MIGILALTSMLVLGQNGGDVFYTNQRNHAVPVTVDDATRAQMTEFRLFYSSDQGRTWKQAGNIPAAKKAFAFYAPGDGAYWLQVASVDRQGVQNPDDRGIMNGKPHLRMLIDTVQPIIKSFRAQRVGDEVAVSWDIQEENFDYTPNGVRLEYMVKDALIESWKAIPITPGMKGQTTFRPSTNQTIVVRLTVRDLAGNQSLSPAEVAGTVATTGFSNPQENKAAEVGTLPMLPGGGITLPKPAPEERKLVAVPPVEKKAEVPPPLDMRTLAPPPTERVILPPPVKESATDKVVADTRTPVVVEPPKGSPVAAPPGLPAPGGLPDVKPLAQAAPARRALPAIQYINNHLVRLQYEIKRQGPSGIGGMQIWLTRDDGATWAPYAEVKDLGNELQQGRQEREFEFRDKNDAPFPDGVYGLMLVVKNRAGLGREPRPGDAPEIRIEIDTKPPTAQLWNPIADPQNPNQLLLRWHAEDRNLHAAPINLEWAEKLDGPWHTIKLELENTGRYVNQKVTGDFSWKVPPGTPVQVYLRMRVRDLAGNESVAVTREPQFVDLVEPEGALIGVLPGAKR
jgi:hypothetical protein